MLLVSAGFPMGHLVRDVPSTCVVALALAGLSLETQSSKRVLQSVASPQRFRWLILMPSSCNAGLYYYMVHVSDLEAKLAYALQVGDLDAELL